MKEEREHDDDILQELEGSPLLKSLKGNPAFDAPAGYFDRFQDQFKDLLDDEEELAAAPLIRKAGKTNIFSVPARYFEELPAHIMARIGNETRVISLWTKNAQWAVGIAAALTLLIAFSLLFQNSGSSAGDQKALTEVLQELSETEMLAVAEDADIDEYDLMYALDEADIADMEQEFDEETWDVDFLESDLSEEFEDLELELDEEDLEVILTDFM